ncbi:DEAD/DEAH box helicase [Rhodohalobacter sp. 8-1]|uniref:DEAD/DEAH box helicase n=1 Tax=Rhodohalobacter sp. 8-1 TaxID=3131972 RepID=UPI0030ED0EA0
MSFHQFRLSSDILKGLKDVQIESPSSLQKKIFSEVESRSDLVINTTSAEKPELGYLLSLLNSISKAERRQGTRAIILASDAERAKQIDEWIWAIGYHAGIESACLTGENEIKDELATISAGPVIIISTPKRLADVLETGRMVFREVEELIVDQADLVEDFTPVDVISQRIINKKCQKIFTAAKDSKLLREAEEKLLTDPSLVKPGEKEELKKANLTKEVIKKDLTQYYINVPPRSKISILMAHLDENKDDTVVIFAASRRTADRLYKILRKSGRRAVSVHDKVDEKTFKERFEMFTSGSVQNLIVGELSAADIDLEHASKVINYDVPEEVEEYKLRAELVGDGKATKILSLVSKQDRGDIKEICSNLGYAPKELPVPKEVQEKKPDKKKSSNGKSKKSSKKSGRSKDKPKKRDKRSEKKKSAPEGLPRPTFDQLSGGRKGKEEKEEKSGVVKFFKKLFS